MRVRFRAFPERRFAFVFPIVILGCAATVVASNAASVADVPPALAAALVRDADVAPCYDSEKGKSAVAYARANFQFSTVTLANGPKLAVVQGGGSCVCGNANCKLAVYRSTGEAYVPVLSTYAIEASVSPDGSAVITSHDSAAVSYRTTYRWNGSLYAEVKNEIVLEDPHTVKLANRTVRFASGASTATLRGDHIVAGYPDTFVFDAAAGQTVTLTLASHDDHFGSFALLGKNESMLASAHGGSLTFKLPSSGTYEIEVDGGDQTFSTYALELAIR